MLVLRPYALRRARAADALVTAAVVSLVGCAGAIDEAGPAPAPAVPPGPGEASCGGNAGLGPLRRLTRSEYDATIRDLLGVDVRLAAGFVPDEKLGPFDANVSSPVSELALEDYLKAADQLARRVVSESALLAKVVPCADKDAACGRRFIETFGLRAYRRPLAADEIERLHRVFLAGLPDGFEVGVRLALQTMLASPHFLYHLELGRSSGPVRVLDGYELASRLSYFLWGSMPDPPLLEAARTGELDGPGGLEAHARRLLADARARAAVRSFATQWLGITKLLDRDEFDHPIGPSAHEEIARLVDEVVWSGDGKLPTLFTTRTAFVDGALATTYGVARPAAGFGRVELDPRQRAGLLTRVAPLAAHRTPTARGKFVRAEILCQHIPLPPPDVDTALPPGDPDQPPRARWEKHVADPSCGGCHRLMDPIGFGFDHYDGIGKYRTMDGRWPVDARGEIVGTAGSDGPFAGAVELSERISRAVELGACATREMFVFALGRLPDPDRDRCALAAAEKAFREEGQDVRALLLAVARSGTFRLRRVEP